ncbi:MAG: NADH-quinone oxidoreductase subunit NuoH [Bacteroidota bacterium]
MDMTFLLDKTVLVVVLFLISLGVAAYSTYFERKVAAFMQDRIGPDRAGPFGLLQPLADGAKFFFKEEIIPNTSDKFLFIIGPSLAMLTSLMTSVVVPWGLPLHFGDHIVNLQVVDINIGILYVFGVVSLGTYGILIGGWASNNKFALMGAIRASSQMISYELAMGMSIVAIVMFTGSLSLTDIVNSQQGWHWNIFYQPLGFLIFLVCAFAECNRTPFDLPESETELIGGYHTEYSSMKLGLYLFAEYVNMFISSAVISCIYFGGYHFPFVHYAEMAPNTAAIISIFVMLGKTFFFIFFFMWVRWTIPRFRYDQLMKLGWQILIPLAIFNILATGAVMTFFR